MSRPGTARLFFALWPDSATRQRLEAAVRQARQRFGGRPMRADTLHLTLLFIGAVTRDRLDAVRTAGRVGGGGFRLRLDSLACWHHIAYLRPHEAPAPMLALVQALRQAMLAIGLCVEKRSFVAHVTLCRNAECHSDAASAVEAAHEAAMEAPIEWPVAEYVLMESSLSAAGPRYCVLERYPLAGIHTVPGGLSVP